jgi:hypothetical protein
MFDKKQSTKQSPPPIIISLTLPTPSEGGISLEPDGNPEITLTPNP